ncbi:MAG: GNVR domain-containing protein [Candidatus Omnitrophota bacterium]|jgi:capsular polysaccharide biosynthesis protein
MENETPLQKYNNPLAYLKLFFRRKWFVLTPLYIGLVLGVVAYFVLPATYEASTAILVEEQRTINPLIQDLAVSASFSQRLQTIRERLLGWNNLTDLVKKLELAKNVESQSQFEDFIKDLAKKIRVELSAQSIIRISYGDKDPQTAYKVVKTLTDLFVEESMRSQTKETDVAINFLKEQLQVYKRKVKESEIADLEEQLRVLTINSTVEHPLVKELKYKVDQAKKALESGEYKIADSEKPITKAMRETLAVELEKLNTENSASPVAVDNSTSDVNGTIYKLFLMDKLDSAKAQDIRVNEQIYNMLLQRLETAKITQRLEASKQGTRYTIIDPPRLPLKPKKPKILFVFVGLFVGCAAGVGLVFAREFMDQSFLDIDDAKNHLKFPILGAISRITTREEIDNEKHRQRLLIISGLAGGIFVMVLSMLYSLLKQ